jgi:hypothetical protein
LEDDSMNIVLAKEEIDGIVHQYYPEEIFALY